MKQKFLWNFWCQQCEINLKNFSVFEAGPLSSKNFFVCSSADKEQFEIIIFEKQFELLTSNSFCCLRWCFHSKNTSVIGYVILAFSRLWSYFSGFFLHIVPCKKFHPTFVNFLLNKKRPKGCSLARWNKAVAVFLSRDSINATFRLFWKN